MENKVAAKDEEATDDNVTEDSADDNVTQCEEEVETATVVPPDLGEARLLCEVVPPSCLPPGPADPEVATVLGDVAPGPTVELEVGGPEGGDPGGGADGDTTEAPTALPAAAEGGGARHLDAMQRLLLQTQAELQEAQAALALRSQGLLPKSSGPPPPYSWLASSGGSSSAAAPEPPSVPSGRYPSSNPSVQMYKKTNCTPEERMQRDQKNQREAKRKRRRQQEKDDQNRPKPPP